MKPETPGTISRPKPHDRGTRLGVSPEHAGYRVSGRVWVEKNGEVFVSWGRVVLLERIREHGSISAAARSMGMGYRHAWLLLDQMNRLSPRDLVERCAGGRDGGGTRLTATGEALIEGFWKMVAEFGEWLADRDSRLWKGAKSSRGRGHGKGVAGG